jgi:hypothetical protein
VSDADPKPMHRIDQRHLEFAFAESPMLQGPLVRAKGITCIPKSRNFIHLAAVLDWFRRRVPAWPVSFMRRQIFASRLWRKRGRDTARPRSSRRIAARVIGGVRDAGGVFVNLPGRTVEAFVAAGARFCNDAILVTAAGSRPIRVGWLFTASCMLGGPHQNPLVFHKGGPRLHVALCAGPGDPRQWRSRVAGLRHLTGSGRTGPCT